MFTDWQKSNSSSIKLLQAHLQVKRTAQQAATSSKVTRKPNTSVQIHGDSLPPIIRNSYLNKSVSVLEGDWNVEEEYDPNWPNDYEKLLKERVQQKEAKIKTTNEDNIQVIATKSLGLDYDDDDDDTETDKWADKVSRPKAAIAPPPSLMESTEPGPSSNNFGVSSVAAKIMAKMGYKEGQGLGRDEQGISKALQIEKTSKTQGKIIIENERRAEDTSLAEMSKAPSRVLLLRNMVGPGEVDQELQSETKAECERFGEVIRCIVYEFEDFDNEEDAVWIFIEFKSIDSSLKG